MPRSTPLASGLVALTPANPNNPCFILIHVILVIHRPDSKDFAWSDSESRVMKIIRGQKRTFGNEGK